MFLYAIKNILRGRSFLRLSMNHALGAYSLKGKVLDIGSGKHPEYHGIFKSVETEEIFTLDQKFTDNRALDLEKDALPYDSASMDQVLFLNVLEHIYNYKFVLGEARRVLKDGGELIGFVPFLINVHPDPHDYFRYTKESLEKIFTEVGFSHIEIKTVARGPFAVNFNNIVLSFPRFISVLIFPFSYILDSVFLRLRPRVGEKFPLGYIFALKK